MKKTIPAITAVCLVLLMFHHSAAAAPKLVVKEPVYGFESVLEGEHISHTFVITNTGSSVLTILDVLPP